MPAASNPVDQAFNRHRILSRLLALARERALADPTHQRNVDLGLIPSGFQRRDAMRRIEDAFEDLGGLVNHLGLLDMAAAFERYFRARLDTAIGEARKAVREKYRASVPLYAHRESLIREVDEFQGLAEIERLIGRNITPEVRRHWEMIRENRNLFAHGTDIRTPPTISGVRAREILIEMIEAM
jgi:hypothetical protein